MMDEDAKRELDAKARYHTERAHQYLLETEGVGSSRELAKAQVAQAHATLALVYLEMSGR